MQERIAGAEAELCVALAGDLDGTFERLVRAYQDRLYNFALRMTASAEEAEEIAQDAFVRAYRALHGYDAERIRTLALQSWLYQITLNVTRNRVRGKRLALVPLEQPGAGAWELADSERERPEALAVRREQGRELGDLLAALPSRYRAALVLRYVGDMTYDEVAAVLNQPAGTVKSNVHRGLALLRKALAEREPELAAARSL